MFSPEDREEDVLWLIKPSLHQLHFACGEGELRPGSSGWMCLDTEALDFLTVRRAEQAKERKGANHLLRPVKEKPSFAALYFQNPNQSKVKIST